MKISVRSLLLSVVVLAALALNACSGVSVAPGSGFGFNDLSSTEIASTASVDSLLETATPDASSTPEVTETPDVSGTPEVTETPSVSETPNANEVVGVVTAMNLTTITVDGVVYNIAAFSEIKGAINVGDTVKLEFITNADGTLTVREVKVSSGDINENGNSNENGNDNGNDNGNINSNENENGNVNSNENSNGNRNDNGNSND